MEHESQPVEKLLRATAVRVTYGSSPRSKATAKAGAATNTAVKQPLSLSLRQITGSTAAKPLADAGSLELYQSPAVKRRRVAKAEDCLIGGDSSETDSDEDSKKHKGAAKRTLVQMSLFSKRPVSAEDYMEPRNTSLLDQCFSKKKSNLRSSKNNYNSSSNSVGNGVKKEQTFLDFGQKPIAPDPCKQCGMAFQRGRKEDEELHSKYHRSWIRRQSRLLVWNACTESGNDAAKSSDIIIVDCQTCTKRELQRGLEIINVVNDCLGAVKLELSDLTKKQRKLFLHVSLSGNKIDGCVLAEMIAGAHRLVAGDACQPIACLESEISATCGISRIWVAPDARRSGVASRLIDAVRMHFVYGCSVPLDEIAFTQPTADGLALGRRIFGRKDFLVYTES